MKYWKRELLFDKTPEVGYRILASVRLYTKDPNPIFLGISVLVTKVDCLWEGEETIRATYLNMSSISSFDILLEDIREIL